MIKPQDFFQIIKDNDINFFSNVPDSLLKNILNYIEDNARDSITAQNEGGAIALAVGHYLATGKMSLVSMQNSGWGHALNPLLSLVKIYKIPMMLMIGWRGEPSFKDAPQHKIHGKLIKKLLSSAQIPFEILPKQPKKAEFIINNLYKLAKKNNEPVVLLVRKNTFVSYKSNSSENNKFKLSREEAISVIAMQLNKEDKVIPTTGKTSRELNEVVEKNNLNQNNFFYMLGSMGHASLIGLKVALSHPKKRVYCFDGDGALLMHMGALPIIGSKNPSNFIHIILNNGAHDSVGGQLTVGLEIDIPKIAKASKYKFAFSVASRSELKQVLKKISKLSGPILIEIKVKAGARGNLSRPKATPIEIKEKFMSNVQV